MPFDAPYVAQLIEDWKMSENDGEEPTAEDEATGDQLVSLNTRLQRGATPFADFGVWRPFGNRLGRALRFVVHHPRADGSYQAKEINGPSSFAAWLKCWRVFAFAMSALKQACRTRLQRYADRIAKLSEEFPNHWWIIGMADIHMRSEHIERVRRECVRKHQKGELTDFDAARPWDVAFREAAADEGYWQREVDKKVLLYTSAITSASRLTDPGYGPIEELSASLRSSASGGGPSGRVSKRKRGAQSGSDSEDSAAEPGRKKSGKKQKAKQRKPSAPAATRPSPAGEFGRGAKRADYQRPDGRYVRAPDGTEICYAYAHRAEGCKDRCPQRRAHICEWCRGDHRSTDERCTKKPSGWTP